MSNIAKHNKDKSYNVKPYGIMSMSVILCLMQQTYFLSIGSDSLSQAKEASHTLTAVSNTGKDIRTLEMHIGKKVLQTGRSATKERTETGIAANNATFQVFTPQKLF